MISSDQSVYYLCYSLLCALLVVSFIRLRSSEGVQLTTREFKAFRDSFSWAYAAVMLGELLATASFYHSLVSLKLSLEQIVRLYCVSTAVQVI
jgi:hypothetical protein